MNEDGTHHARHFSTLDPSTVTGEPQWKVPLWVYSVIGLLSVGLLISCLSICIYLHLRRKWRQRRDQHLRSRGGTPAAGSKVVYPSSTPPRIFADPAAGSTKKPSAASTPQPPQVASASSAPKAINPNSGEAKKKRGWLNSSGSIRNALSRLSGPEVASGGSSDSRSFKIDNQTVSYGSRFHVAQSPDASVHFRIGGRRGSIPQYPYPKPAEPHTSAGNWSTDGSGENESEERTPPSGQPRQTLDGSHPDGPQLYSAQAMPAAAREPPMQANPATPAVYRGMTAHEQVMMPYSLSYSSHHWRNPSTSSNTASWSPAMAQTTDGTQLPQYPPHQHYQPPPTLIYHEREVPHPVADEAFIRDNRSTFYRPRVTSLPVTCLTTGAGVSRLDALQLDNRATAHSASPPIKRTSRSSSECRQDNLYRYEVDVDKQAASEYGRSSALSRQMEAAMQQSKQMDAHLTGHQGRLDSEKRRPGAHVQRSVSQRSGVSGSRHLQRSSRYISDDAVHQSGIRGAQPPWEADLTVGDRQSRDSGLMSSYPDWAFTLARKHQATLHASSSGGISHQRRASAIATAGSTFVRGGSGRDSGRQSKESRTLPFANTPTPEPVLTAAAAPRQSPHFQIYRDYLAKVQPSTLHV